MTTSSAAPSVDFETTTASPSTADPPEIRAQDLWYSFGAGYVLRKISFTIERGEVFGLVGPYGAGKTTLLRLLATLLEPKRGVVEVLGYDTTLEPERVRESIGYLPDRAALYAQLTVQEYLEFFARLRQVDMHRIPELIERLHLGAARLEQTEALNAGARLRLGLARALLHDPQVLILDEPMNGLDAAAKSELHSLLSNLRSAKKTVLISSHSLDDLNEICSRVGIIDEGLLLAVGPISEIAARLQDRVGGPERSGGDFQRLRLRVIGDPARVAPLLSTLPAIVRVQIQQDEQISISYKSSEQFVPELIRYLVEQGVSLLGVEPEQTELERILLTLTEKS